MARQTEEQMLMKKWWLRLLIALIFLGISYGFASLAIDSGSLWQYALTIIFFVWAVRYLIFAAKHAFSRLTH